MLEKYTLFLSVLFAVILAALLLTVILQSWLRSRRGKGEFIAKIIGILKNRSNGFRKFQYPLLIITAVILAAAISVQSGWSYAAVYIAGVVICFASVIIGNGALVSGTSAAVYASRQSDIPSALRASHRTGALMGLLTSAAGLLVLALIFIMSFKESLASSAGYMALGASTVAVFINTGGSIYSSAYSLASPDNSFTDRNGFFAGIGADSLESYIFAGIAAISLADVAVATSGVTSTFTATSAVRYPMVILGAGVAASVLGGLIYRGGTAARPFRSASLTYILAAILLTPVILFFSNRMLQSMVYGYTALTGIAAGILITIFSSLFTPDGKILNGKTKNDRLLGVHAPVIADMGIGSFSVAFNAIIITAAISVSFNFAGLYGIAVCAAGIAALAPSINALAGVDVIASSTSDILETLPEEDKINDVSDVLYTAASHARTTNRAYFAASYVVSAFALLAAIIFQMREEMVLVSSIRSISGIIGGVAVAIFLTGLLILSVRTTATVALKTLRKTDYEDESINILRGSTIPTIISMAVPALIGLLFGVAVLVGFLIAIIAAAYFIMAAVNNSGRYLENTAVQSLGSLVKMMVAFTFAFLQAFVAVGGLVL